MKKEINELLEKIVRHTIIVESVKKIDNKTIVGLSLKKQ